MDSDFGRNFRKLAALLVVVVFSVAAFAQTETGQLAGTVTDPQGAVVVGAKVTVKNTGTGAERNTTTSSEGLYSVLSLPVGTYAVTVEAASFGKSIKNVAVTVGSRTSLDFKLLVAGGATTVEIHAQGGVAVDTQTQALDQVVSGQQITELPTLTRNAYSLVGVSGNVSGNDPTGRGAGYAINGQRAASTGLLLDGGENVDLFVAAVGQLTPLDSVGEFRVITSNFSAEYGRAGGGIVNVTTKGGSNAFHGTVYEFYRGASLSSNTYDNNANGTPKGNFVRNQFGYSIGGPIIKNKLFFFSSSEWIRVRSAANITTQVINPAFLAASNANTQGFYTAFGAIKPDSTFLSTSNSNTVAQSFAIAGSSTGTPGAGGCIGYTYPDPDGGPDLPGATGGTFCTFALANIGAPVNVFDLLSYVVPDDAGGGAPRNELQTVARIDFTVTDKTTLFGRYTLQKQDFFAGTVSSSPYVGFDTGATTYNQNMLFSVTHIWNPHLVTTSKLVFNRLNVLQPLAGASTPTLYMKSGSTQRFQGQRVALPGNLPFSPGNGIPFGGPQNLYQFYQDLRLTHGKHQMSFGGQYIHTRDNRVFGAYQTASEILGTNLRTALNRFLSGTLNQFQAAVDPQGAFPCATNQFGATIVVPSCQITLPVTQPKFGRNNRYHDAAIYAEDSWRIHPRFTLNLGVRWEYYGVQHNVDPSFDSNFFYGPGANTPERLRSGRLIVSTDPANPVGGLWEPDRNNFAPRVGFAWDLFGNGKTSLRGGYGMGFERNFGNVTFNVIQNPPKYAVISLFNGDVSCTPCVVTTNNAGPLGTGVGTVILPKTSTRAPITDMKTAYSHFYSLALERELAKNTILEVGYSGSRGIKLYSIENPSRRAAGPLFLGDNPADQFISSGNCLGLGNCATRRLNDQYTNINQRGQRGFSYYNALNIRLQTNNFLNSGWTFVTNYTWSHSIDNLSSTFSEAGNNFNLGFTNPYRPQDEKGNADFDIRHRWVFAGTWDTPWFKSDQNWFKKNILGGWTFAPIVIAQRGNPFTVWDCSAAAFEVCQHWIPAGDFSTGPFSPQPGSSADQGGNTFQYIDLASIGANTWVNPVSGTGEFGVCTVGTGLVDGCPFPSDSTGRNQFRAPGVWNIDLGIYKNIRLTERFKLQFRGEFFNMMNHANLYVLGGDADFASSSGQVTAKRGGFGTAGDERRNIQLALKLIF